MQTKVFLSTFIVLNNSCQLTKLMESTISVADIYRWSIIVNFLAIYNSRQFEMNNHHHQHHTNDDMLSLCCAGLFHVTKDIQQMQRCWSSWLSSWLCEWFPWWSSWRRSCYENNHSSVLNLEPQTLVVDTVDKSQYIFINKIYILIFLSMVSFQPLTTVVDLQKEREPGRRGTQTKYGRSEVLRIVSQELCK